MIRFQSPIFLRILRIALWASAIMVSVFAAMTLLIKPEAAYMYVAAAFYVNGCFLAIWASHKEKVIFSITIYIAITWLIASAFMVGEGPRSGHFGIYFVTIILAGLLVRPSAAIVLAFLSAIVIALVHFLAESVYQPPGQVNEDNLWLMQMSQLIVAGILTGLVTMGLHKAMLLLKTNEATLAEQNKQLQDQAVLESELRRAQKMEAIGRISGGVAHDLNNLLTVIISCSELIENKSEDDFILRNTKALTGAALSAARVTGQLLALSKRPELGAREIDMSEMVKNMGTWIDRLLGKTVQVSIVADAPVFVHLDPAHLEQVVLNLIVNAQEAMPAGGKLDIFVGKEDSFAILEVIDSGKGIDEATLKNLFEPDFSTKAPSHGSGIGLATIQRIIRAAKGDIHVTSTLGAGARFKISLPSITPKQKVGSATISEKRGEKVLLIDDDDAVRSIAAEALRNHGYKVFDFEGLEPLKEQLDSIRPIQLIVSDVVLQGHAGTDVVNYLRNEGVDAPVIYISGYTAGILAKHGVSQGAAFLAKPFTSSELAQVAATVLNS